MLQQLLLPYLLAYCHFAIAQRNDITLHVARALEARQSPPTTDIPAQCEPTCDPVNTAIESVRNSSCSVSQCFCTSSFVTGFFSCYTCYGTAMNLTDYSQEQNLLDSVVRACAANGTTLSEPAFPGQATSTVQQSTVTSLTAPLSSAFTTPVSQQTVTNLPTLTSSTPSPTSSQTSGGKASMRGAVGVVMTGTVMVVCYLMVI